VKKQQIFEVTQSQSVQVDREAGVIRGVRILGPSSLNNRTYTPEAIRKALPLYEGKQVNCDHPSNPRQERKVADRAGWLENVIERDGGLNGDLHLLKADPRTEKILESAEKRPALFGLSHNAEGDVRREKGRTIVEEIVQVRSVDIVADPASTRSLFESLQTQEETKEAEMPKTIRSILENLPSPTPESKRLQKLLEEEPMAAVADAPVDAPADADPNEEVKAALQKAASAIIGKLFAGEMDKAAAFKKLGELLGMKEKAASDSEGETTPAAPDTTEGVDHRIKRLEAEIAIRDVLQEAGVKSTPARVKALVPLSDDERAELVESWKGDGGHNGNGRREKPHSRPLYESAGGSDVPKTTEDFVEAIT